jgi:AraC-like DNA-binding protein
MPKTIRTPLLTFRYQPIRLRRWYALAADDQLAHTVAQPLFDAGIDLAGITERGPYQVDPGRAPYHVVQLLLQGQLHIVIGEQEYDLQPGDLAVCPAGVLTGRSSEKFRFRHLYFLIADTPIWAPLKKHGGYVRAYESAGLMFILLRDVMDAKANHEPAAIAQAQNNCRALVDLLRHEMVWGTPAHSSRTTALQALVEAVTEAPAADWDNSKMAAKLGWSVSWMRRQFRKDLGLSPLELVIRQRMIQATQQLASTRQPIKRIAKDLGYDNLHYFTRLFTRIVGLPPGRYRARYSPYADPLHHASR